MQSVIRKEQRIKTLPTIEELKSSFRDFSDFTFELLSEIDHNPRNLKFAAVNSQIALELFLKYFYMRKGEVDVIRKKRKGEYVNDFNDFSQILNNFYSMKSWSFGEKKELAKLLDVRNSIVHRGQDSTSDDDIAESIVRTLFFIHATAWSELGETLFFNNYVPHKIGDSKLWRKGAESFAVDVADIYCDAEVHICLGCEAYAAISGELMVLDDTNHEEDLVCLNCFSTVDLSDQARLLECYQCFEKAFYIDALNEQGEQLYVGKCVECETNTFVRKCKSCEDYYHPSEKQEVENNGLFFCSKDCYEFHI